MGRWTTTTGKGTHRKENKAPEPGADFWALGAKGLYGFAKGLMNGCKITDWPPDAYERIAKPRNRVTHRTCQLVGDGSAIALLEDFDVEQLRGEIDEAMWRLSECSECFQRLYESDAWRPSGACSWLKELANGSRS